jgi:hypothetical protein
MNLESPTFNAKLTQRELIFYKTRRIHGAAFLGWEWNAFFPPRRVKPVYAFSRLNFTSQTHHKFFC